MEQQVFETEFVKLLIAPLNLTHVMLQEAIVESQIQGSQRKSNRAFAKEIRYMPRPKNWTTNQCLA